MRITDVTTSYSSLRQLQNLQNLQKVQQEKLVSGRRVNHLEDDPATAANVLDGRVAREALIQMRDNAGTADSIAETSISTLDYLKGVANQAQAVIESTSLRGAAGAQQVQGMLTDAVAAANTRYNGEYLFGGSATGSAPFSIDNDSGQVVYNGSGDGREFNVSGDVSLSPFTSDATNQEILGFLNGLVALRDSLAAGDNSALPTIGGAFDQAEDAFLEAESSLGLKQARIEVLQTRDAARYGILDQAETKATSADESESIVELLNTQKAFQGALQSIATVNQLSLLQFI